MILDRLGVITDEVSSSLTEALDWAVEKELKHVEIRVVNGTNCSRMTDEQVDEVRYEVEKRGLYVSAISSPIFKCALDPAREVASGDRFGQKEEDVEAHFSKLHRCIQIAKRLGTTNIRIFSFWRENEPNRYTDEIVKQLRKAADIAEMENITLLLENEPSCNGGYADEVGELVRKIASNSLKVLWDPGNEEYGGRSSFPEGYNKVSDQIGHVHLKDALIEADGRPRCVPIGEGGVPFLRQLIALEEGGYKGLYTIETHFIPEGGTAMDGTSMTLDGLRHVLGQVNSK